MVQIGATASLVRARATGVYKFWSAIMAPHTYLDGIAPFTYLGLWLVEAPHSTATLSSGRICKLYGLWVMHRPNIFLSRFGHSGWAGSLFCSFAPLTLTLNIPYLVVGVLQSPIHAYHMMRDQNINESSSMLLWKDLRETPVIPPTLLNLMAHVLTPNLISPFARWSG